jgi:hypothetical protein
MSALQFASRHYHRDRSTLGHRIRSAGDEDLVSTGGRANRSSAGLGGITAAALYQTTSDQY